MGGVYHTQGLGSREKQELLKCRSLEEDATEGNLRTLWREPQLRSKLCRHPDNCIGDPSAAQEGTAPQGEALRLGTAPRTRETDSKEYAPLPPSTSGLCLLLQGLAGAAGQAEVGWQIPPPPHWNTVGLRLGSRK